MAMTIDWIDTADVVTVKQIIPLGKLFTDSRTNLFTQSVLDCDHDCNLKNILIEESHCHRTERYDMGDAATTATVNVDEHRGKYGNFSNYRECGTRCRTLFDEIVIM